LTAQAPQTGASSFGAGLGSLFDLQGVYGSFLIAPTGNVVARALPELVDDATLSEVSGRVIRLADTFEAVGVSADSCVLRFAEHKLYFKHLATGVLCILADSGVNLPALRMAANVVARKVGPEMARAAGVATPPLTLAETVVPRTSSPAMTTMAATQGEPSGGSATGESGPSSPGPRMYRGRPIG
jgi:predicted regulator of Ras-like GTPase activity (Roadblock/LC7/MglB family)